MSLPLWVTEDHRKPVTHAHYPKEELLVSALVSNCFCVHITLPLSTSSTDGELKLWLQRSPHSVFNTLSGHLNTRKTAVGLTVNNHFIAGGKQRLCCSQISAITHIPKPHRLTLILVFPAKAKRSPSLSNSILKTIHDGPTSPSP